MKHYADLHHSEKVFEVGDMVYLKLQPYIQSSVAPRSNQKVSFKFCGLFKVLAMVGAVAYKLQLPDECRIHAVVHTSTQKRHIPPSVQVEGDITDVPMNPELEAQPVHFLESRMIRKCATLLS